MKLDENFMRSFRWITPLLLFFLNIIAVMLMYVGKEFISDVKSMRGDITDLKVQVATINGHLMRSDGKR